MQQCLSHYISSLLHTPYRWYGSLLLVLAAWSLSFVVDKSCTFVEIRSSSTGDTFGRGTQRGQIVPTDSCEAWASYEELELDSNMVWTRTSAALTIVVGALVWIPYLLWLRLYNNNICGSTGRGWVLRLVAAGSCILCAVFQALTHLMVHSELCKDAEEVVVVVDDELVVVYDECSKTTTAYNITFATMGLWVLASFLVLMTPLQNREQQEEKEQDVIQEEQEEEEP
jgi:hypothetical protein